MKLLCLLGLAAGAFAMGGDMNDQCCGWAIMDECETNPFWMKVNCQKSCGTMGCTVAGAKADKDGAEGACRSNKDMAFLSSCAWNREYLEANWNPNAAAGGHGGAEIEESQFIVPDGQPKAQGSYGGEAEKPEPAPMDVPQGMSMVPVPMEEEKVVEEPEVVEPEVVEPEVVETSPELPLPVPPMPDLDLVDPIRPEPEVIPPMPDLGLVHPPTSAEEEIIPEPPVDEIIVEEVVPEEETLVIPDPPAVEEELPEEQPQQMDAAPVEEPAAEDMNDSCCGWAAYEECGKNAAWMKTNCAKSCFVMDGKIDEDAAIANAEENCGEYRELFLAGVPLGQAKKAASEEKIEPEVEEKSASEEVAPEEPEAPVEEVPEEPEIEPEAPVEEPEVEEPLPEEPEVPVEEEPEEVVPEEVPEEVVPEEPEVEEPQADPVHQGGYRRRFSRFRASRN